MRARTEPQHRNKSKGNTLPVHVCCYLGLSNCTGRCPPDLSGEASWNAVKTPCFETFETSCVSSARSRRSDHLDHWQKLCALQRAPSEKRSRVEGEADCILSYSMPMSERLAAYSLQHLLLRGVWCLLAQDNRSGCTAAVARGGEGCDAQPL